MTISIVNHKGGTGKTTTAINIGTALAASGQKVLLVDFDAQGSLTYSLGIDDSNQTISEALLGEVAAEQIIQEREGMSILPAGSSLADVELVMAKVGAQFNHLKNLLLQLETFDFVLIDCSPSLSLLTINALCASSDVVVPMQMDVLALRGLDSMLNTIKKVKSFHSSLEVLGILPVMVDARKNIHDEISNHIKSNYTERLFEQSIRISVRAAEAPSFGKSVVNYAPTSTTALDYQCLAQEILVLKENFYESTHHKLQKL